MSTNNLQIQVPPITNTRFTAFLVWQSIQSATIFTLTKLIIPFSPNPNSPSPLLLFPPFLISLFIFSASLSLISSPQQLHPVASPGEVLFGLIRVVLGGGVGVRIRVLLGFAGFVVAAAVSGFLGLGCFYWGFSGFWEVGFKGFVVGVFYGLVYVFRRRWILEFPLVQRPPFFSFKIGIPSAVRLALKFSFTGYLLSAVLAFFLPKEYKVQVTVGKFIAEQIIISVGIFFVFLCWELSHHLHQVLHTKRFSFAPPKGSAAAETNPSEPLLAALEESKAKSILQYLAYLDLCMVCESNSDTWRRAAFFEESGETYKRVLAVCLRPLEQFTLKLAEGFESCSNEALRVSHLLTLPTEQAAESILQQAFYDVQLCAWCARIVASLTVHSRKEDRFGVAQLSGSNFAVISTLLSCLLAVETCIGKKTNIQSPHYLMSTGAIKWATVSSGRRDPAVGPMRKRKGNPLYSKAYSMADILRISIYSIVATFHKEMANSSRAGLLEKDWIVTSKPLYGSHELLLQKLSLFLDFRAT